MPRSPSAAVAEALAVTIEACGAEMSEAAVRIMLADLAEFSQAGVLEALKRVRREHKGRLSLAAIIERIDDGRPGVEVAWSMVPRDEATTAVLTCEMLAALSAAHALLAEGDEIAARMAFKEAYTAAVTRARAEGVAVQWQASLGWDAHGRVAPLADAVRCGRLTAEQAMFGLDSEARTEMLALAGIEQPALPAPRAEVRSAIAAAMPRAEVPKAGPKPPPETEEQRTARIDAERVRVRRMLEARGITEQDMQAARRARAEGASDATRA